MIEGTSAPPPGATMSTEYLTDVLWSLQTNVIEQLFRLGWTSLNPSSGVGPHLEMNEDKGTGALKIIHSRNIGWKTFN